MTFVYQVMSRIMKHSFISFVFFISVLFTFFSGCSKQETFETESNPLFTQMIERSEYFSSVYEDCRITKSGDGYYPEDYNLSFDINAIDEKYLDYIDMYIESENTSDWDERSVLDMLNVDTRFSYGEKMIVVDFIAGAFAIKNEISVVFIQTKGSPEQCERDFYQAMKRATRDYAIAMCVAALEPTCAGELAATVLYYCWIDDAQTDYNDCMSDG